MVCHAASSLCDFAPSGGLTVEGIAMARTETPMGVFAITGRWAAGLTDN